MKPVTFLRLRPAERITSAWAAARRSQGSTAVEVDALDATGRRAALGAGLLPVSSDPNDDAAAWVVDPADALVLGERGIPGWRITVRDERDRAEVLDAVARSRSQFLRTGRSRVAAAADLAGLPGLDVAVSVFVDTVEDAAAAVDAGAVDLLLRDWDTERLGALRDALSPRLLVERTVFGLDLPLDAVRAIGDADLLQAYLNLVDGSGAVRPRYEWAPGKAMKAPVPGRRLSAEWADAAWTEAAGSTAVPDPELAGILERSLSGTRPSRDEVARLFRARGPEVEAVAALADELRKRSVGDTVTYVVNRNINYTNLCTYRCGFCAFSKGPRSLNLRGEPYLMTVDEVAAAAVEAAERGATEVTLQGGIHPSFTGEFYLDVLRAIKAAVPEMHCHGFTPLEVWQGAATLGVGIREFLVQLQEAGLGSLPGTAAEILDDDVREHLCADKIRTAEWAEVMIAAHEIGLASTATIMFGHIDGPESWADHFEAIRRIQERTGGFTEFVPLPFVHMGAPIYLQGRARPGPTWDETVLIHAVARIAFDGLIPNIQASWVKVGLDGGLRLLEAGCNDLGGTLMNEIISRAAGASHGQTLDAVAIETAVRSIGRTPQQRTTLYGAVASIPAGN